MTVITENPENCQSASIVRFVKDSDSEGLRLRGLREVEGAKSLCYDGPENIHASESISGKGGSRHLGCG